jgi:hypothetical protein
VTGDTSVPDETCENKARTNPALSQRASHDVQPCRGLDAVEMQLKSHDIRRIGTDDPQGLANALKALPRRG